ncbi:protein of unknown function [Caballeronia sp. S22]
MNIKIHREMKNTAEVLKKSADKFLNDDARPTRGIRKNVES